jgi:hypothetical protein
MALCVRSAAISVRIWCRIGRPMPRCAHPDHPSAAWPSRLISRRLLTGLLKPFGAIHAIEIDVEGVENVILAPFFNDAPEIDVAAPPSVGGRAVHVDGRPIFVACFAGLYRGFAHSAERDVVPNSVIHRSSRGRRSLTGTSMECVRHGGEHSSLRGRPCQLPVARRAKGGRCRDDEARNAEGADDPSAPSQFPSS